ncbi:Cu(I)-responsive transcriptional regulator [Pseudomaricurvus sp. HS19]|uniref:Cu(I)-responsive transcriptional regulator n=1 Tax=Pseudomaricurvus sp. HS19 TaxID=2692626 RepID=UPI0013683FA4|nr:Cu(I)-responsive transcriptional regulator [Pseudomaricurvus sp. HS19]
MNISEVARLTGLTSKTIRYYETLGLIDPDRAANGYRTYGSEDVEALQFLQRARATGFGLDESRQLLGLYREPQRHSAHVRELVQHKLEQVNEQINHLQAMAQTLQGMVKACRGDDAPDCAIIDRLADSERK